MIYDPQVFDTARGSAMRATSLKQLLVISPRCQLYHAHGKHRGVQILHAGKIDELLYGTLERGLPTDYR